MEPEDGSGTVTVTDLKKRPVDTIDSDDLSTPTNKSHSSSSSSSSSSLSDVSSGVIFQVDADEFSESTASSTGPSKLGEDAQLISDNEDKMSSISITKHDQSDEILGPALPLVLPSSTPEINLNYVSETESPTVQIMERPAEPAPYRIPSSVFARTSATTPVEWSVASNESLFSIHMGNMSFTKEQLSLFGDLGRPGGGDLSMSSQFMNFSSSHLPINKTREFGHVSGNLGEDLVVAEAAAETMKEVLRVNANQQSLENNMLLSKQVHNSGNVSPCSDDSAGSHNSFAFPILAGVGAKSGSVKRVSRQDSQPQPRPHQQQMRPKSEQPSQAETWAAPQRRWFSCFSCCPYCS